MYNGTIGGIGEGLQSFVQAYQTALNYQLEKSKASALSNYQQAMADVATKNAATEAAKEQDEAKYQQALGAAAGQNAQTERAKARGEYLQLGNGVLEYYAPDLMDQGSPAAQPPKAPEPAQAPPSPPPPSNGLLSETSPGFIGPPQKQNMLPSQAPPSQGLVSNAQGGPPQLTPTWKRQLQNSLLEKGLIQDPQTGEIKYAPGPLGQKAQTDLLKDQATVQSDLYGARSPQATLQNEFNQEPIIQSAKKASQDYAKLVKNANQNSPAGDKFVLLNMIREENPGYAPSMHSLEDVQQYPGIWNKYENLLSEKTKGTLDPKIKADYVMTASEGYKSLRDQAQGVMNRYNDLAAQRQVNPRFTQLDEVNQADSAFKDASERYSGNFAKAQANASEGLLQRAKNAFMGLLPGSSKPNEAQDPKVSEWANQHGLNYDRAAAILKARGYGQ